MKVASAWRESAQLRDFSAPRLLGLIEYLMAALLGLIGLALVWAIAAPTGEADRHIGAAVSGQAADIAFDPFFRLNAGDGRSVVTSLDLTLYGVRADQASGRGSAIIGLPDGTQNSYAVGDQIVPGAVLAGVGFDSVTIRRDGALEKLYLDQSHAAPVANVATAVAAAPAGPDPFAAVRAGAGARAPYQDAAKGSLTSDVLMTPRQKGDKIDGYVLQPSANGQAFRAAGLRPGDVVVSVDGVPVTDSTRVQNFYQRVQEAGSAKVGIERDGRPMSLTIGSVR